MEMDDLRAMRKAEMNRIIGDWVNSGTHDTTELSRMLTDAGLMVTANSTDEAFDLLSAGAVSVHVGSDEQDEPTDPDPDAPALYNVYTKVNNWEKSTLAATSKTSRRTPTRMHPRCITS